MKSELPQAFLDTEISYGVAERMVASARVAGISSGLIYIASTWGDVTKPLAIRVLDNRGLANSKLATELRGWLLMVQQSTRLSQGFQKSGSEITSCDVNPGSFAEIQANFVGRSAYCEVLGLIATLVTKVTKKVDATDAESIAKEALNKSRGELPQVSNYLLGALFLSLRDEVKKEQNGRKLSGGVMVTLNSYSQSPPLYPNIIGYQEFGPYHPTTFMALSRKVLTTITSGWRAGPHTMLVGNSSLSQIEGSTTVRVNSSSEEDSTRVVAVHGLTSSKESPTPNETLIGNVVRGNLFGVSLV